MRDYWPTHEWRTAAPATVGLDPDGLESLRQHVRTRLPHLRSLAIVRHGYLVLEEYYQGLGPSDRHEVASITKSLTSLLLGIAFERGELQLARPLDTLFGPELDRSGSPAYAGVTVAHLLAMTGGFAWNENNYRTWLAAPDQTAFALELARAEPPGTRFQYNTPAMHLLSVALTRLTQRTLAHYAREHLLHPIGITDIQWPADRQGNSFAGHGVALATRDLARVGLLVASGGRWDGRQIVPESWIRTATSVQSPGGPPEDVGYGYLWWVTTLHDRPAYFAGGYGGQFIVVVPSEDLVVVTTSNLDRPHPENRAIVADFILPALKPAAP